MSLQNQKAEDYYSQKGKWLFGHRMRDKTNKII
jgi:hypothetical protein